MGRVMAMRVDSSTLLEGAYASWWARDLEAVLACFADDVVFVNHLPADVVPFAGPSYGKAELRQQLQIILDQFDFLEYRPVQIVAKRRLCHSQVHFRYLHKATGRSEEHTSELQSRENLVCRLLLEKKKKNA